MSCAPYAKSGRQTAKIYQVCPGYSRDGRGRMRSREMHNCTHKLLRVELYERAWRLRIRAAEMEQQSPIPEWDGGDLSG